jgi:hypothetical protein
MRVLIWLGVTVGLVTALASAPASAGLVSIDFDQPASAANPSNYVEDGFRFSPNGYYNVVSNPLGGGPAIGYGGSTYLNWEADPVSHDPGGLFRNAGYGGPAAFPMQPSLDALLYVDAFGTTFSLKGIDFVLPLAGQHLTILASSGASYAPSSGQNVDFNSDEWNNLSWILFGENEPGVPMGGIDHLVFAVPEVAGLALFGPALLLFAMLQRRRVRVLRAVA